MHPAPPEDLSHDRRLRTRLCRPRRLRNRASPRFPVLCAGSVPEPGHSERISRERGCPPESVSNEEIVRCPQDHRGADQCAEFFASRLQNAAQRVHGIRAQAPIPIPGERKQVRWRIFETSNE